jgi:hypothetical protein
MFRTLKGAKNSYRGYPTAFAGSTQNIKKNCWKFQLGTSNQPIRTKIFQKNNVLYLKSVKEPKIRMGPTRRNLQAQPKILKK